MAAVLPRPSSADPHADAASPATAPARGRRLSLATVGILVALGLNLTLCLCLRLRRGAGGGHDLASTLAAALTWKVGTMIPWALSSWSRRGSWRLSHGHFIGKSFGRLHMATSTDDAKWWTLREIFIGRSIDTLTSHQSQTHSTISNASLALPYSNTRKG
jgi:hypothetical protein